MNKDKVVLNVGGKRFETLEATLKRIPDTLLGRISDTSPYFDTVRGEFFFDRDPFIFTSVLNLYRIGELHLPHNICGPAIRRELLFWEVDENTISECCWRFYKAFEEEQSRLVRIRHAFGFNKADISPEMFLRRGDGKKDCRYWHHVTWRLLSDPTSSLIAKVWAWVFFLLLLMSISVQILRSEPMFRGKNVYMNTTDKILILFYGQEEQNPGGDVLRIVEDILTVFFAIELSLRFAVCPEKKKFFKDTLNWVDVICVVPMVVIFIVRIIIAQQSTNALTYVSAYLSVTGLLRVLRLLKLIQHAIGFKILVLTLRASMKEIVLLMGLISLCTVLFAVSVYFAEIFNEDTDFPSISAGLWWAIITMTTVGYGDMYPRTIQGRLIGTLCAMCGILTTGLAIPVIASNFDKFYSDAQVLKQAKLTEGRPKNSHMRKRVRDPFSTAVKRSTASILTGDKLAILSPASEKDVQLTQNGEVKNGEVKNGEVKNGEVKNGEVKNGEVTQNGEIKNKLIPNGEIRSQKDVQQTQNGGEVKSKFSLSKFNKNAVMPLDNGDPETTMTHLQLPTHPFTTPTDETRVENSETQPQALPPTPPPPDTKTGNGNITHPQPPSNVKTVYNSEAQLQFPPTAPKPQPPAPQPQPTTLQPQPPTLQPQPTDEESVNGNKTNFITVENSHTAETVT